LTPTQFPLATPTLYSPPEPIFLPDETAGWRSYTNEEGKFSIKYPQEWPYVRGKLYEGDIAAGTIDIVYFGTADTEADSKPEEVIVLLAVYKDSSVWGKTPGEFFKNLGDLPSGSVDPATKREITLGGLSGIRAIVKGVAPFSDTIVISKNGYLYRVELLDSKATNENRERNEKMFDLMLSTFRFLG
jgi:hypothetical protein